MSIILITHDLGVVAETCDKVLVMYGGRIVEEGAVSEIFQNPKHPYTRGLLNSIPNIDEKVDMLKTIDGSVPTIENFPKGCRFADRCEEAKDECHKKVPQQVMISKSHKVSCILFEEKIGHG